MPQILIRDLDHEVVQRLKARAKHRGRSLQAEVKALLEQAAKLDMASARALATRIRRRHKGRKFSDSADLVRADRER